MSSVPLATDPILPPGGLFASMARGARAPIEGPAAAALVLAAVIWITVTAPPYPQPRIASWGAGIIAVACAVAAHRALLPWSAGGVRSVIDAAPLTAREWSLWAFAAVRSRMSRMVPWALVAAAVMVAALHVQPESRGSGSDPLRDTLWMLIAAVTPALMGAASLALCRAGTILRLITAAVFCAAPWSATIAISSQFGRGNVDQLAAGLIFAAMALGAPAIARRIAMRTHPSVSHADERRAWLAGGILLVAPLALLVVSAYRDDDTITALCLLCGSAAMLAAMPLLLPSRIAPSRRHAALYRRRPVPVIAFVTVTSLYVIGPLALTAYLGISGHAQMMRAAVPLMVWLGVAVVVLAYGVGVRVASRGYGWGRVFAAIGGTAAAGALGIGFLASGVTRHGSDDQPWIALALAAFGVHAIGLILIGRRPPLTVPDAPPGLPEPSEVPAHAQPFVEHEEGGLWTRWNGARRWRRRGGVLVTALVIPLTVAAFTFGHQRVHDNRLEAYVAIARSATLPRLGPTDEEIAESVGPASELLARAVWDAEVALVVAFAEIPDGAPLRKWVGSPPDPDSMGSDLRWYSDEQPAVRESVCGVAISALYAATPAFALENAAALDWATPFLGDPASRIAALDLSSGWSTMAAGYRRAPGDAYAEWLNADPYLLAPVLPACAIRAEAAGDTARALVLLRAGANIAANAPEPDLVRYEVARGTQLLLEGVLRRSLEWTLPPGASQALNPLRRDAVHDAVLNVMTYAPYDLEDLARRLAQSSQPRTELDELIASLNRISELLARPDWRQALRSTLGDSAAIERLVDWTDPPTDKTYEYLFAHRFEQWSTVESLIVAWRCAAHLQEFGRDGLAWASAQIDPAAGEAVHIRENDDSTFTIWCVGPDLTDDDGSLFTDVTLEVRPRE